MSGDYSKLTFRPEHNHTGVQLQQGRVQLDSDWNEALAISLHRSRTETRDVIGLTGVPSAAPGFALSPAPMLGPAPHEDMIIMPGRAYVAGKLLEVPVPEMTFLRAVEGVAGAYAVVGGPILRAGQYLASDPQEPPTERVAELLDLPEDAVEQQRVRLDPDPALERLQRMGLWSLAVQPWEPLDARPREAETHIAWLEVVERDITVLDAPYLREPALGGPDTTTRKQLLWRVMTAPAAMATEASPPVCKDFAPPWSPLQTPQGRMAARTVPGEAEDRPCIVPATGGYRGVENGLWRVQVHGSGEVDGARVRLKWARDNGMLRVRLLGIASRQLTVSDIGPDSTTALSAGDWLELTPDPDCFEEVGGWFIEIDDPNGTELGVRRIVGRDGVTDLVDGEGRPDVDALPRTGLLRRWDGGLPQPLQVGAWLPLEKGIEVRFAAERMRNGDYWTIPARALTGDIEWPMQGSGHPAFVLPDGLERGLMALALIGRDEEAETDALSLVHDCRPIFEPLTSELDFEYRGGNGQEVLPDASGALTRLPQAFRVGVIRGTTPLAGHLVRFRILEPGTEGRLFVGPGMASDDVLSNTGREMIVRTRADGIAEAWLGVTERQAHYDVQADLLDAGDPDRAAPQHMPIRFNARAAIAREVGFDAENCAFQSAEAIGAAPATTVQQAIDRLCPAVRLVKLTGDGQVATAGEALPDPLSVGLYWGNTPLRDAEVVFKMMSGDAVVVEEVVATDDNGVAGTRVIAGTRTGLDEGVIRVVVAPQFSQPSMPESMVFRAQFARGADDPGIRVDEILYEDQADGDFQPMPLGGMLTGEQLSRGFTLAAEGALDPRIAKLWYVAELWLDVPLVSNNDPFWDLGAARAMRLGVDFRTGDNLDGSENVFNIRPDDRAQAWLSGPGSDIMNELRLGPMTGRLVVHGDWLRGREDGIRFVDGEIFGDLDDRLGRVQPTGDGRRGGDLVMPFLLTANPESVRPSGFGAFTLPGGPRIDALGTSRIDRMSRAFDLAIDRQQLDAFGVIDRQDMRRPEILRDTQSAQRLFFQDPPRESFMTILAPQQAQRVMRVIEDQIRDTLDFSFEIVDTRARTANGIVNAINQNGNLDAVLLPPGMLEEIRGMRNLRRPPDRTLFAL